MNEKILQSAFTAHELEHGAFSNLDGRQDRMLSHDLIEEIKNLLPFKDVRVVLDIGSRDGCQSLELNRWFPNAIIYAFEPVPASYNFTLSNTRLVPNIKVFPYCVSDHNGTTPFYEVYTGNIGASSLSKTTNHPRSRGWLANEIEVETIILEDWLSNEGVDTVDIAWVDVQGAEETVFRSLGSYLSGIQAIATEVGLAPLYEKFTPQADLDNILKNFTRVKTSPTPCNTEADLIYVNQKLL